jgi:hypothetical protein
VTTLAFRIAGGLERVGGTIYDALMALPSAGMHHARWDGAGLCQRHAAAPNAISALAAALTWRRVVDVREGGDGFRMHEKYLFAHERSANRGEEGHGRHECCACG